MKIINYFLIVYFSLVALLPKCDLNQLTALDELYFHYVEHCNEAEELGIDFNLADFLYDHFVEIDEHHSDNSKHENLPLKNITGSTSFFHQNIDVDQGAYLQPHIDKAISYVEQEIPHDYIQTIFHPPLI